ncbi:MAG: hypothetical protein Q7S57_02685 [bacterium]|nr:hypothetical protein [bacterium]
MLKKILPLILPIGLITLAVLARLIPHAPNLAPIAAVALLSGTMYKFPKSLILPLVAMAISDFFIGFSPWPITLAVYGSFAIATLLGTFLRKRGFWKIPAVALASSLLFYVITNFVVWLTSGMYQPTFAGLIYCYINALPFLKNTIIGDMTYTIVIFTLVKNYLPSPSLIKISSIISSRIEETKTDTQ